MGQPRQQSQITREGFSPESRTESAEQAMLSQARSRGHVLGTREEPRERPGGGEREEQGDCSSDRWEKADPTWAEEVRLRGAKGGQAFNTRGLKYNSMFCNRWKSYCLAGW